MVTKPKKQRMLNPDTLLKIIAVFLIFDFFAFQKKSSGTAICLLVDIPLLLFAATNFIWAKKRELPYWHPLVPYGNLLDEGQRVFWAHVSCIMCVLFAILIVVVFPFFYEAK